MKLPAKCPTCGDPLITDYNGVYTIINKCFKYIDHRIEIKARQSDDEVYQISILLSGIPLRWAIWHPLVKELVIHRVDKDKSETSGTPIPYFEPQLSDYPKLIDKLKTYIVFS